MRVENFLNVHIVHTLPFSNVNRDDTGSPKSSPYGGVQRARISSQALKRAQRVAFEADSAADMTLRSKFIPVRVASRAKELLEADGVTLSEKEADALAKKIASEVASLTASKEDAKGTLIWLAESECEALAHKVVKKHMSGDSMELTGEVFSSTAALSIAAFGRFFAAQGDKTTEAAVQVAHAFATHAQTNELDYFTAVDDLRAMVEGDSGAGHLDVAEFTSGTFYRYFNIDRRQLLSNWSAADDPDAKSRLSALLREMIVTVPSGKENSTAPHTPPTFVLLEVSRRPFSYAGAFEQAVVSSDGFEAASIERLKEYSGRTQSMYGSEVGNRFVLDLTSGEGTLDAAVEFCSGWLLG